MITIPEFLRLAREGDLEKCRFYLKNVHNALNVTHNGENALHYACRGGHDTVVKFLLKCGIRIIVSERGISPLHDAVESGSLPCVELLIKAGALRDFDHSKHCQVPFLHLAAAHGYYSIFDALLAAGADPTVVYKGASALDVAKMAQHDRSVEEISQLPRRTPAVLPASSSSKGVHNDNTKFWEYNAVGEGCRTATLEKAELSSAIDRVCTYMGDSETVCETRNRLLASDICDTATSFLADVSLIEENLARPISLDGYSKEDLKYISDFQADEPLLRGA